MPKNMIMWILIVCFFFFGCASVGKNISQSQIDKIERGKTTKTEVINMLGQPDGTYFEREGKIIFYYQSSRIKQSVWNFIPIVNLVHSEMQMKNQMLSIIFSKDSIVDEISFTNSDKPLKYGIIP